MVRGFSSQSYADIVRHRVAHEQRKARLLVVGDFDCSGEDIERDWVERTGCWSSVTRVLFTYEQMRAYGSRRPEVAVLRPPLRLRPPPPGPVGGGGAGAGRLQRLVLAAVAPYIDRDVLLVGVKSGFSSFVIARSGY
nr:hypothetical protein OG409_00240 [Streptomyces sp. NBC_00974]WSX54309.1 hypothetical protein OG409_38670 [Streptomyces sp. NBC_00974]